MGDGGDANITKQPGSTTQNPPVFTYARACVINFEKDTVIGNAFDAWIMEHRNETDLPCEIVRVFTWLGAENAKTADKASFLFTPNAPHNNNQGQPVTGSGTFNMVDETWTEGTWNPATRVTAGRACADGVAEDPPCPRDQGSQTVRRRRKSASDRQR
ncbi:MAG: hypothetical protein ACLSVD_08230 [Eggerthellaceae bacterium]